MDKNLCPIDFKTFPLPMKFLSVWLLLTMGTLLGEVETQQDKVFPKAVWLLDERSPIQSVWLATFCSLPHRMEVPERTT